MKYSEILETEPYLTTSPKISDIQLAARIISDGADENSIFYKNTLEVIPNPTSIYSNSSPVLFYYAEIYNLLSTGSVYMLDELVYNGTGALFHKKSKILSGDKNSIVNVGLINLRKFPTDSYNLVLSLIDTTTKSAVVSFKKFYHYNPGLDSEDAKKFVTSTFMKSEFSVMSDEECDDLFDKCFYLSTNDEKDRYEDIDSLDAKRNFLYNFWKMRDQEPATPDNEFKREYLLRVDYCNEHFKSRIQKGFKTDMGRVYMLNGAPDEREYYPMTSDHKPYEVWSYHQIESGVVFIFGDVTGTGTYELLTSTKQGEVKNQYWQNRITISDEVDVLI